MKKIAILAALFSVTAFSQAEEVIAVYPQTVEANASESDYESFQIYFSQEDFVANSMRFYLYLPQGMTLNTCDDTQDSQEAIILSEDRTYYTQKGSKKSTGHSVGYNFLGVEDGFNKYSVLVYAASGKPFSEETGPFCEVYYVTDGLDPGIYPVMIKNVELNNAAEEEYLMPAVTSYVKVGTPASASLVAAGEIPSFVNVALANETAITTLNLSAVTAVNGTFTYVDGREVVAPAETVNAALQYVGNKSGYSSINLPFEATIVSGEVYYMDQPGIDCMFFEKAASVQKDHTYLANGAVTLKATNAELAGVYTQENKDGMFVYENKIWYGENLTVKPTRGIFDGVYDSNLRIVIDGELTGITAAQIDAQSDNTYDLQGRQVQNAKNGVFVVNGKKQFVK